MLVPNTPYYVNDQALATMLRVMYIEKQDARFNQPTKDDEQPDNPDKEPGKQKRRQIRAVASQNR